MAGAAGTAGMPRPRSTPSAGRRRRAGCQQTATAATGRWGARSRLRPTSQSRRWTQTFAAGSGEHCDHRRQGEEGGRGRGAWGHGGPPRQRRLCSIDRAAARRSLRCLGIPMNGLTHLRPLTPSHAHFRYIYRPPSPPSRPARCGAPAMQALGGEQSCRLVCSGQAPVAHRA